jgi:sortase B
MEWEIFAVYVVDSGYNYVITMDFADDAAFLLFLNDIEKRTMYPMPFEVTTDDKILTMVTCSYEFDGARTVIQARLKK